MSDQSGQVPSRLPTGEWRCIIDGRTEPCGECSGCREVQAENTMSGRGHTRRVPCDVQCPCICHDGFGGAHPHQDCRDALIAPARTPIPAPSTSGDTDER